jgi:hypothetical protein
MLYLGEFIVCNKMHLSSLLCVNRHVFGHTVKSYLELLLLQGVLNMLQTVVMFSLQRIYCQSADSEFVGFNLTVSDCCHICSC